MKQSQLNTFFKQLSVADSSNEGANGVASTAEVQRPAHRPVMGQATPKAVAPTTQVQRPAHRPVIGQATPRAVASTTQVQRPAHLPVIGQATPRPWHLLLR